jgi:hypothetical protein
MVHCGAQGGCVNNQQAWIHEISEQLAGHASTGPGLLRDDLARNFRALLQSAFARLDLVTREEFEIQQQVLARLRVQVTELERTVAALERAQP